MPLVIYFMVQCHSYQLRLCWQLSSIQQQVSAPQIVVDVAAMPGNGCPTTEAVIRAHRATGLQVHQTTIEDRDLFARRGLVRNEQIKAGLAVGADWFFFADADNVYPERFFHDLQKHLDTDCADVDRCIFSAEKWHTEPAFTQRAVMRAERQHVIDDCYHRAMDFPVVKKHNKKIAAGCMQVVSAKALLEKASGMYVTAKDCKDHHLFNTGQRARSDIQFRNRMGGSYRIELAHQIHLNHVRDKELGYHTDEQR